MLSPEVLFLTVFVVVCVFAGLRALALWYWRVNEMVTLLTEIRDAVNPEAARAAAARKAARSTAQPAAE